MNHRHPWIRSLYLPAAACLLAACSQATAPPEPAPVAPMADAAPTGAAASTLPRAAEAPSADDLALTTRVKTALHADAALQSLDIQVISTKGDVRLIGQVDKPEQKDRALELARSLEGVHSIHDEVTLKP